MSDNTFAQDTGIIRGKVRDAFTFQNLDKVTVQVVGQNKQTFTDENGEFEFDNLPLGRAELKLTSVGYGDQLIKEILVKSGKVNTYEILMESKTNQLEEVKVSTSSPNLSGAVTSLQSINIEQVMRFPATFFDPARLAFAFPGVANTNDQANGMSIRGNNPNGLQWRLEGLEIVNPNHLANAGTFSDQPAANAGGTNMLSAQMLGNMNFLTGAFPAEYGNALSGVMDMRLRKGNNKEFEHTIQAGLIGVDLSSEGPLSKKNGSSYLINYRYSFTGLLALGGLSFGGETIKFQDLAVNLSFPTKKAGDFTIFGMGGLNSNEFAFDDEDGLGPQEEKDLNVIDYYGKMGVVGATHQKSFRRNLSWKTAIAYSGLTTERNQTNAQAQEFNTNDEQTKLSFTTAINKKLTDKASIKAGFFITKSFDENYSIVINNVSTLDAYLFQPYVQYSQGLGEKALLNIGVHHVNYSLSSDKNSNYRTFEPRLSLTYQAAKNTSINAAFGKHSQYNNIPLFADNQPLLSDQYVISIDQKVGKSSNLKMEGFYQNNSSTTFTNPSLAFANNINLNDRTQFRNSILAYSNINAQGAKARNYGLELSYQKYLDNGFFALVNTTLYKSEFEAGDGNFYESKYSGNYILNLTLGKEWTTKKNNILGANARVVWMGGFRDYEINVSESKLLRTTIFDYSQPLLDRNPDYFRPDIRVYYRKNKGKKNIMWSLDIQNLANYQNVAFKYYDSFLDEVKTKYQLGMIPMLNYRIEF